MSGADLEQLIRRVVREERGERDLLSIAEAAAHVGYGVTKIRAWLKDGTLKRYGEGRCVRVSKKQLLQVMEDPPSKRKEPASPEQVAAEALRRIG